MTTSASSTIPGTLGFAAEWDTWHAAHESRRADPHGFLAITSLNWLTDEPQRFPDAPGVWQTGPDGVVVTLADGEELEVGGARVRGRHSFGLIPYKALINQITPCLSIAGVAVGSNEELKHGT